MKRFVAASRFAICACLLAPLYSHSATVMVSPSVVATDYRFDFGDVVRTETGSFGDGLDVEDTLVSGALELTLSADRWYVTLTGEDSDTGSMPTRQFITDFDNSGNSLGAPHAVDSNFERREFSVTVGRRFYGPNFGSWRRTEQNASGSSGTVKFDAFASFRVSELTMANTTSTDGPIFGFASDGSITDEIYNGRFDIDFDYQGVLIGAQFEVPMPLPKTVLLVRSAYSFFDGEFAQEFTPAPGARTPNILNAEAEGSSAGTHLEIGLIHQLTGRVNFFIKADRSVISFRDDAEDVEGDFTEEMTRYEAGVSYAF